ncbi:hypothetical protein TEA_004649 [Camellia sinensis var. sinensis]|uniref:C2H2-type domain-containing protein n=1 Tax=Camellia sinensis var. sinensis TaxID=542762 RepID=A0A4S4E9T4_CAMSN|nr:hypothetical protein TEA_004649 [Camellia sinensis var. sinensis]
MVTVPTTITTETPPPPPPCGPKLESLTHIDISKLSQSELHALSLCSSAAFDLRRTDDIISPQIDRTVFNESAGSRRQTYSRLRLDSSSSSSAAAVHRSRLPGLLPNPRPPPSLGPDDPEHAENKSIVNFLKQLITTANKIENSDRFLLAPPPQSVVSGDPESVPPPPDMQIVVYSGEMKRKRGRKPKPKDMENGGEIELEIVNKNGVVVDFRALENGDELYGAELRRRTVGLEKEEEVLGFLRNFEGQWGSRRKKRKIVDASEFGDSLPIGWKLLLGLKRREGQVSVYCRRYISPSGQQFVSCKEAASYLQSYFGLNDASQPSNQMGGNNQQVFGLASENNDDLKQDTIPNSMLPSSSIPNVQEMEISLMEIDNLPDVEVRDLFECYKCNLSFDEKNTYLKHLMSVHQRTTRRYRLGSSIGEGVIIKDGKYECQICHKVFQERRSYNGHVGIHVRNCVRSSEELPGQAALLKCTESPSPSPSPDELPPRITKMDALIQIAQKTHAANSDHKLSSDSGPNELENEDCMTTRAPDLSFNQHDGEYIMTDNKRVNSDHVSHVENNLAVVCTDPSDHPKFDQVEKHGNSEQEIGFGNSQLTTIHDVVTGTSGQIVEENVCQSGVADSSMPVVQSLPCFPLLTTISNKGENEFCTVDQKLDNVTAFDDLRLDEIEPLKFNFVNGQDSPSLPEVTMNLANDEGMEEGFNSSAGFETEAVMLNIAGRLQFTTVCVWCRTEFNHEAVDSETQSDSVGFMCPTCKAKISGQLNVLDSVFSSGSIVATLVIIIANVTNINPKNACTIDGTNEDSGGCSKPSGKNCSFTIYTIMRMQLHLCSKT